MHCVNNQLAQSSTYSSSMAFVLHIYVGLPFLVFSNPYIIFTTNHFLLQTLPVQLTSVRLTQACPDFSINPY